MCIYFINSSHKFLFDFLLQVLESLFNAFNNQGPLEDILCFIVKVIKQFYLWVKYKLLLPDFLVDFNSGLGGFVDDATHVFIDLSLGELNAVWNELFGFEEASICALV